MVKLVRMVANRNISTNEIRNTFNPSFVIEPKSRVALHSVRANLALADNYQFTIDLTNNTLEIDGINVTIPPDTYTINQFKKALRTAIALVAGKTGTSSSTVGEEFEIKRNPNSGILLFEKTAAALGVVRFTPDDFEVVDGSPSLTDGEIDMDSSPDQVNILSLASVPNASFYFEGEIGTLAQFGFGVNSEGSPLFGLAVGAANEYFTINPSGTPVGTGETAMVGDTFSISRVGNTVTFEYGANSSTYTVTEADQIAINESEGLSLLFEAPAGSTAVITDLKATMIPNPGSTFKTAKTKLTLLFGSESLAKYCGFNTVGPTTDTDDPAVIDGNEPIEGDLLNPGVIVTIDPLVLETYDGDQRNTNFRGQNNILYVLNNIKGRNVEVSEALIPLNINNAEQMQINQLRVQFRNQANGEILDFNGEPSLVLVIYGPDE